MFDMYVQKVKLYFFALAVPMIVRNLSLAFVNASFARIIWLEPAIPNGIVSYNFSIVGVDLLTGDIEFSDSVLLSDTEYLFTEGILPYSNTM